MLNPWMLSFKPTLTLLLQNGGEPLPFSKENTLIVIPKEKKPPACLKSLAMSLL